ncbi:TetR/AcrR family transcriptional regulator [Ktedonospora formicarum]|uniref:TetR family transcriptional regulator n=1 Tax=Ktedonospora formicarum TaxID=2778364 RepID=A0A8J3I5H2_9CHLR|nr:TetR/AcrR family transcriptional regulator [Ktedonospora formicarum]GHO47776.1 TetR family transcriptional regulator [Ktedonospora formicarum]
MSHISGDLRVRRTQKLIREAFIALIEERGFDALTVADIASRAMVSRTAFYRYYEDKYDMVLKLFEEIVAAMNKELDSSRREAVDNMNAQTSLQSWGELFQYTEEILPPYVTLFEHVAEYERLYRALLGKRGSTWFVINLRAYLARMIEERLQALLKGLVRQQKNSLHVFEDGFVPTQIASLLVDTITWWLEEERPYSPRQLAIYYTHMMCAILKDVPAWDPSM